MRAIDVCETAVAMRKDIWGKKTSIAGCYTLDAIPLERDWGVATRKQNRRTVATVCLGVRSTLPADGQGS